MQTFRILYLRQNRLEHTESLDGLDLLEVIDKASGRPPDVTAEIWSQQGKVGIVGPLPRRRSETVPEPRRPEAQIAELMRSRLRHAP